MIDPPSRPGPTRRGLLGSLLGGVGLAAAAPLRGARAASTGVTWSLRAVPTTYTFPEGTTLPFQRLQHAAGGTTHGLVPVLEAVEGERVTLELDNDLDIAVRPALVDVVEGPRVLPGTAGSFSFTMPAAGSYLLGPADARRPGGGALQAAEPARPTSGFSAMVISRPASGLPELWSGGPSFDREYFLLYEDADDRRNLGQDLSSLSTEPYEANFFMVNGLAHPDTLAAPGTVIVGRLGERILIRLGNLGRMRHAIHLHGYHAEVVARNRRIETVLGDKDSVPLQRDQTTDLILVPHQTGIFPMHPHGLQATTAGGLYPFGQITRIEIT